MTPTDFNLNNLLVDEWGNVKHLVDLEFFCALPLQMCYQLRWLTGRPIDKITDHYLDEYNETQLQFLDILRELEAEHRKKEPSLIQFTKNMEIGWRTGRFWYSAAVMSVNASYNLFHHHIYKKFSSAPRTQKMYDHFSRFSSPKSTEVVAKKVADKVEYERQKALRRD
ncbi:hypothetical protein EG328_009781 [Venturia inaequalis]|uniref:Aminoglycoside phosphotransferase domain-containing protein n=1 Tax=Venturia inaequalis TaxID=5025 RepID=A0A8H3VAK2_VENIN|nr:hypothetical protein EG328_009781 [Venturia inaequalis]